VASLAVFNQTGEISPTTLYVPPASGIFRVTSYVVFTTRAFESTGATVGSLIHWKDEQKSESGGETGMGGSGQPVGYGQNEIVIHAIAGQPIQFSTFHGPSISPFNAYFTVIQE
jgi:hypothetical protein